MRVQPTGAARPPPNVSLQRPPTALANLPLARPPTAGASDGGAQPPRSERGSDRSTSAAGDAWRASGDGGPARSQRASSLSTARTEPKSQCTASPGFPPARSPPVVPLGPTPLVAARGPASASSAGAPNKLGERARAPTTTPALARPGARRGAPDEGEGGAQPRYAPGGWDAERRRGVLRAELRDAPPEPEVRNAADLTAWQAWAMEMVSRVQARTHPRRRLPDGRSGRLPVWRTTPQEMGRVFGPGLRLYFDLLRFLCGFFLIGAICAFPSLELNVSGGPDEPRSLNQRVLDMTAELGIFLFPQGYLYATSIGPRIGCTTPTCQRVSLLTIVLDCTFVVCVLVGVRAFSKRIRRVDREIDIEVTSVSDFSVQLRGFPHDVTPAQVQQHVERVIEARARSQLASIGPAALGTAQGRFARDFYADLLDGRKAAVFEVVPLLDNYALLAAALDKAPLEAEAEYLARRLDRLRVLEGTAAPTGARAALLARAIRSTSARLAATDPKLRDVRARIAEQITGRTHRVVSVIVSFHHEAGRIEALTAFSADPLRRAAAALGGVGRIDERYTPPPQYDAVGRIHTARPRVVVARELPEPADLILENFAFEGNHAANFFRRRLSDLAVFVLLFGGFLIFFWAEVESNRAESKGAIREVGSTASIIAGWASLVAVVANALLRELVSRAVAYERRTLRSQVQLAISLKVTIAQVANVALIAPLVSSAAPAWLPMRLCTSPEASCGEDGVCCILGPRGLLFRGSEADVSASWFANIGAKILLTMSVQLIFSIGGPIVGALLARARRRLALPTVVTLEGMVRLHHGAQFEIADRYGELLAYAAVVLIYAPGLPLLYLLGAAYTGGIFWIDKWLLLTSHPHPPPYDTKLAELAVRLLPSFVLAHCLFALRVYALTPGAGLSLGSTFRVGIVRVETRAEATLALDDGTRAQTEAGFLGASVALVFCALAFGQLPAYLTRTARELVLDLVRPYRVGAPLEGNPRLVDAIAGCEHPVLRRSRDGVLYTPADVREVSGLERCAEWLSPTTWFFKLIGIHLERRNVPPDVYLAAAPVRVHLDESHGHQSSYSPENNPFYKAAFMYDAGVSDAEAGAPLLRPAHLPAGQAKSPSTASYRSAPTAGAATHGSRTASAVGTPREGEAAWRRERVCADELVG